MDLLMMRLKQLTDISENGTSIFRKIQSEQEKKFGEMSWSLQFSKKAKIAKIENGGEAKIDNISN